MSRHTVPADERRGAAHDGDRADDVLALAADVEQAGAERERHGQPDENQRRRQDQRLLQVQRRERPVLGGDPREEPVQPRALEDRLVGRERARAREGDDDGAGGGDSARWRYFFLCRAEREDRALGYMFFG